MSYVEIQKVILHFSGQTYTEVPELHDVVGPKCIAPPYRANLWALGEISLWGFNKGAPWQFSNLHAQAEIEWIKVAKSTPNGGHKMTLNSGSEQVYLGL